MATRSPFSIPFKEDDEKRTSGLPTNTNSATNDTTRIVMDNGRRLGPDESLPAKPAGLFAPQVQPGPGRSATDVEARNTVPRPGEFGLLQVQAPARQTSSVMTPGKIEARAQELERLMDSLPDFGAPGFSGSAAAARKHTQKMKFLRMLLGQERDFDKAAMQQQEAARRQAMSGLAGIGQATVSGELDIEQEGMRQKGETGRLRTRLTAAEQEAERRRLAEKEADTRRLVSDIVRSGVPIDERLAGVYNQSGEFGLMGLEGVQVPIKKERTGPQPEFVEPKFDKKNRLLPGTGQWYSYPGTGGMPQQGETTMTNDQGPALDMADSQLLEDSNRIILDGFRKDLGDFNPNKITPEQKQQIIEFARKFPDLYQRFKAQALQQ